MSEKLCGNCKHYRNTTGPVNECMHPRAMLPPWCRTRAINRNVRPTDGCDLFAGREPAKVQHCQMPEKWMAL